MLSYLGGGGGGGGGRYPGLGQGVGYLGRGRVRYLGWGGRYLGWGLVGTLGYPLPPQCGQTNKLKLLPPSHPSDAVGNNEELKNYRRRFYSSSQFMWTGPNPSFLWSFVASNRFHHTDETWAYFIFVFISCNNKSIRIDCCCFLWLCAVSFSVLNFQLCIAVNKVINQS